MTGITFQDFVDTVDTQTQTTVDEMLHALGLSDEEIATAAAALIPLRHKVKNAATAIRFTQTLAMIAIQRQLATTD